MPRKSPYTINLNVTEGCEGHSTILLIGSPPGSKLAIAASENHASPQQQQQIAARAYSNAMGIATRPFQQMLMNAFMMYMSGSSLNVFSISILGMAVTSPLTALVSDPFAKLAQAAPNLLQPKLIYWALNLVWLAIGLYKLSSMRLLPTTAADFAHRLSIPQALESSTHAEL